MTAPLQELDGAPLAPLLNVTLARGEGPVITPAEATDNPHLAIAPARIKGVMRWEWRGWFVVHIPTGRGVPMLEGGDVEVVRAMARLVAPMDWSSSDPEHYGKPLYRQACWEARARAWNDFELGEGLAAAMDELMNGSP